MDGLNSVTGIEAVFFFYYYYHFIYLFFSFNKQEISVYEDCILWAKPVLVPPKGQKAVLQELHEWHDEDEDPSKVVHLVVTKILLLKTQRVHAQTAR